MERSQKDILRWMRASGPGLDPNGELFAYWKFDDPEMCSPLHIACCFPVGPEPPSPLEYCMRAPKAYRHCKPTIHSDLDQSANCYVAKRSLGLGLRVAP